MQVDAGRPPDEVYGDFKTSINQILYSCNEDNSSLDRSSLSSNSSDDIEINDFSNRQKMETTANKYRRLDSATSYREYKILEEAVIEQARQGSIYMIDDAFNIDRAATKIQSAYRGHKVRTEMKKKYEKSEKQSRSNDTSFENLKDTDKLSTTAPAVANQSIIDPSTESKYKDTVKHKSTINTSDENVEEAAVKIQAVYKGYIVRSKSRDRRIDRPVSGLESSNIDINNEEENRAAIKIQSLYRGHLTRRKLASTSGKEQETHTSEY